MIDRNDIVNALKMGLKDQDYVYALWLEGSDGNNTVDEYSDIDIWLDVEDDFLNECIVLVEKLLKGISPVEFMHDMKHPHSKIEQKIYHLKNTSEFLMIDFCWQLHSRDKIYFNRNDHIENAKVIFDKADIIGFEDDEDQSYSEKRYKIKQEVQYRFSQGVRVLKYVHRKQYLEALYAYNEYVLSSLVKYLRSIYTPDYIGFGLLHISQHLPKEHVDKLIYFGRVSSLNDIEIKTAEAKIWFDQLIKKYS